MSEPSEKVAEQVQQHAEASVEELAKEPAAMVDDPGSIAEEAQFTPDQLDELLAVEAEAGEIPGTEGFYDPNQPQPTEVPDEPVEIPAELEAEEDPQAKEPEPTQQQEWDLERQRKDEEMADLRKENERLKAAPAQPETPAEEPEPVVELTDLDEYATEEDRNAAVNELIRRRKADEANQVQQSNRDAFDAILTKADEKYSPDFRNKAVELLREQWKEQGFTADYYPDPGSTEIAVLGAYAQLDAAATRAKLEKLESEPPKKQPPKADPAKSGKRPSMGPASLTISMDEAIGEMAAEGAFNIQ